MGEPATEAAAVAAAEESGKFQIYPSSSSSSARQVTPFWREKYEKEAAKYWDRFYKRHKDKFFKDRHYLDKEWGHYFQVVDGEKLVVLEVGCGAGNTIFPLISTFQNIFVHACDFSPRAVDLVQAHKDFTSARINVFVCDLTVDDLSDRIQPSSVDIVTMIFVLSAVSPEKMPAVLQNIRMILKPNGHVLFRDYANGDLAQERLSSKEQKISENFFVRGDGTRAYYFSNDFLTNLFRESGFDVVEINVCNKEIQNRSLELVMNRRWLQAVFASKTSESHDEIDISDSITEIFGPSLSIYEVSDINGKNYSFKIKALSREYQHTCKLTGLMLWESARLMCNILSENPSIVTGKRVLELGCGSAGICSMVAVQTAEFVVATDGDEESLNLLNHNISSNVEPGLTDRLVVKRLIWGDQADIEAVKNVSAYGGFDIIIGTDVTYNFEAISPLFETAKSFIKERYKKETPSALILCHIERRVREDIILSTATKYGFKLLDKWSNGMRSGDSIISSWFSQMTFSDNSLAKAPLAILYFCL